MNFQEARRSIEQFLATPLSQVFPPEEGLDSQEVAESADTVRESIILSDLEFSDGREPTVRDLLTELRAELQLSGRFDQAIDDLHADPDLRATVERMDPEFDVVADNAESIEGEFTVRAMERIFSVLERMADHETPLDHSEAARLREGFEGLGADFERVTEFVQDRDVSMTSVPLEERLEQNAFNAAQEFFFAGIAQEVGRVQARLADGGRPRGPKPPTE